MVSGVAEVLVPESGSQMLLNLPYNRGLRRLLSIAILLVIAAPAIAPLFVSATTNDGIPACCRRNGQHHCMMLEAQRVAMAEGRQHVASQIRERCPFQPKASPATRNSQTIADAKSTSIANFAIDPILRLQSRCLQRISF